MLSGRSPLVRPRSGRPTVTPRPDLRTYVDALDRAGELVRVTHEVDPDQEIAAIADRSSRALGDANKALLFENVKGSKFPVLINAMGSHRRMEIALGLGFDELEGLIGDFLTQLERPRASFADKLGALPLLGRLSKLFPKVRNSGACQEVVHEGDDIDLFEIPVLKTWPEDGGPMVTLPLVYTKDPDNGSRNCGMYRLQRYDRNSLGFHVHTHHTAAEHLRKNKAKGRPAMEVAVAIGASPEVVFSAVSPLPPGIDEMLFAAFLQKRPVDLVKCRTVDLEVPADAEFVIEGYVPVDELRREGPFGDHTGFYSLADDYHVLHVTAITHRKDAIWHTTVVGPPPQEDCYMGAAIERLFLPLQRKVMPELIDMHMPFAGVFHNLMLLKIKKDYPGQARKVAHTVWGLGQAMFTKVIVVVDEDGPDLTDGAAMTRLFFERLDVSRDVEMVFGPTETLDHASRALHFGSKVCIDLTTPMDAEGERRCELGERDEPLDEQAVTAALIDMPGVEGARVVAGACVVVTVDKVMPSVPRVTMEQIWDVGDREGWSDVTDRILVLDKGERLDDDARLLWLCLSHIDPERDVQRSGNPTQDRSLRHTPNWHPRRIGVDATTKGEEDGFVREWPTEQVHPKDVLNKVAALWSEIGLPGECPR